jgi:hypothetical protein
MKTHHIKHYDETTKCSSSESNTNGCQDITSIFQLQEKLRYLGIGDAKELFKTAVALWMINKGIPFLMVEEKTFRKMFEPLNKKAPKIVNVQSCHASWEASQRSKTDRDGGTGSGMDYWPLDRTEWSDILNSDRAFHQRQLELCIVHPWSQSLQGHHHRWSCIYDIVHVLQKFQCNNTTVILDSIGIADTTGSMGKLGDNISVRTEGGMGTVQMITSIAMLSLLWMVSTWGNGGGQESWPSVLLYHILDVCALSLSPNVSSSSVNTTSNSISSFQLKT